VGDGGGGDKGERRVASGEWRGHENDGMTRTVARVVLLLTRQARRRDGKGEWARWVMRVGATRTRGRGRGREGEGEGEARRDKGDSSNSCDGTTPAIARVVLSHLHRYYPFAVKVRRGGKAERTAQRWGSGEQVPDVTTWPGNQIV
jgi:hypothetical protein